MTKNHPDRISSYTQNYIDHKISKLEKDLTKYIDTLVQKKTKRLHRELSQSIFNMSERSHLKMVKSFFNNHAFIQGFSPSQPDFHSSFNTSNNQLLSSIANELKKTIFNNIF